MHELDLLIILHGLPVVQLLHGQRLEHQMHPPLPLLVDQVPTETGLVVPHRLKAEANPAEGDDGLGLADPPRQGVNQPHGILIVPDLQPVLHLGPAGRRKSHNLIPFRLLLCKGGCTLLHCRVLEQDEGQLVAGLVEGEAQGRPGTPLVSLHLEAPLPFVVLHQAAFRLLLLDPDTAQELSPARLLLAEQGPAVGLLVVHHAMHLPQQILPAELHE
mmetsp:Transcript_145760/g.254457  ORF Transcript_145760/g.254457 Transcript_145760/m.254457 type:complete len:216 (-) Transcript_145760:1291-1938(-)